MCCNAQLTTHQLIVLVVIATTVTMSRCLQAGQQRGLPLGVVPHNSGKAIVTRQPASCDDNVVTAGHRKQLWNELSISLIISFKLIFAYCVS